MMPGLRSNLKKKSGSFLQRATSNIFYLMFVALTVTDWMWNYSEIQIYIEISRILRFMVLILFGFYIFKTGFDFKKGGFFLGRIFQILSAVWLIYSLLDQYPNEGLYQYGRKLYWLIGTVVVYRLTLIGQINYQKLLRLYKIIAYIAVIFTFFYIRTTRFLEDYNASAYLLLYCMPIFFLKYSKKNILIISLSVLGIMVTVKRGAILGLILSVIVYVLVYLFLTRNVKHFTNALVIFAFMGVILLISAYWQQERLEERFSMEEMSDPQRGGSGRLGMWHRFYDEWIRADLTHKVFGFGNRAVFLSWETYEHARFAHSDMVSMAYDYGVIGMSMLFSLHFILFVQFIKMVKLRSMLAPSFSMAHVILLCINLYSEAFWGPLVFALFMTFAFIAAVTNRAILLEKFNLNEENPHSINVPSGRRFPAT